MIEEVPITMEIDTGASVSIINEHTFQLLSDRGRVSLKNGHKKLRTYRGEEIPILGTTTVNVTESDTVFENMQLRIVKGDGPNLLGRDWLEVIKLDWAKVHRLSLSQVLKSNHSVFGEGLGKLEGTTAKFMWMKMQNQDILNQGQFHILSGVRLNQS